LRLKKLSLSWQLERIFQEGLTLVIAGRPNAGKSSLFNKLLKEDRSIVTEVPGTTRDWIEAYVSIEGIPIRLIDTAGLRDTSDSVEKIGVERSRNLLQEAELVIYLIDGALGFTDEDKMLIEQLSIDTQEKTKCKHLYVWNKSDINVPPKQAPLADMVLMGVSAKTGVGLEELYNAITLAIQEQAAGLPLHDEQSTAALGTVRQKNLVDSACSVLDEALALTDNEEPLDLIAPLLREAVNFLGEITGEVSTADILEEMFSRFCVGK